MVHWIIEKFMQKKSRSLTWRHLRGNVWNPNGSLGVIGSYEDCVKKIEDLNACFFVSDQFKLIRIKIKLYVLSYHSNNKPNLLSYFLLQVVRGWFSVFHQPGQVRYGRGRRLPGKPIDKVACLIVAAQEECQVNLERSCPLYFCLKIMVR